MTRSASNTIALEIAHQVLRSQDDVTGCLSTSFTMREDRQITTAYDKIVQTMFERLERARARQANTKTIVPTTGHR